MENKIAIDFREVQPKDLLGKPIKFEKLYEQICNPLFVKTGSIAVHEAVRTIYLGEVTEVSQQTINELLYDIESGFIPVVHTALKEYLLRKQTELQNNLKQQ